MPIFSRLLTACCVSLHVQEQPRGAFDFFTATWSWLSSAGIEDRMLRWASHVESLGDSMIMEIRICWCHFTLFVQFARIPSLLIQLLASHTQEEKSVGWSHAFGIGNCRCGTLIHDMIRHIYNLCRSLCQSSPAKLCSDVTSMWLLTKADLFG